MASEFWDSLSIAKRCDRAGVGLWQCPHFLFPIMGAIVIAAIIGTYVVAIRFAQPEIAALIVLAVAAVVFIVGTIIVHSFENVAEAARVKSEFVSIVSHELRSPLSAIRWSLELLKSNGASAALTADSVYETIAEQAQKMNRLVNTLLEIRRVEDHDLELRPEAFSLADLTQSAFANLDAFARASNVRVEIEAPVDLPWAYADRKKIQTVIESLIDNAIRYSGNGAVANIETRRDGKNLIWSIADRGAGISKEDAKNIFQMFYRAHNIFRYRAGGLGAGLYLARAIIKASGGEMFFESQDGKGSRFWFTLPINR